MRLMCIDIESTGLDWYSDKLHGVGVAYTEGSAKYYPVWDIPEKVKQDLANPAIAKLGHNLHSFDAKMLQRNGFEVNGDLHDPMIIYSLLGSDENELGLKELTAKYIGIESLEGKQELDRYMKDYKAAHVGVLCAMDLLDETRPHLSTIAKYCCEDVNNTFTLFLRGINKLKELDVKIKASGYAKSPLNCYKEECMPTERVLFDMEYRGIRVDVSRLDSIKQSALSEMDSLSAEMSMRHREDITAVETQLVVKEKARFSSEKKLASIKTGQKNTTFLWSNNNHVASLLYEHVLASRPELIARTKKGTYCTDKAALFDLKDSLDHTESVYKTIEQWLDYKQHGKIASTYTGTNKKGIMAKVKEVEPGHYRIFPRYRQTTGTGRFAASDPNMQNIKRDSDIKRLFIPDSPEEVFDSCDYSQIELRVAAHLSKESKLVAGFNNGEDLHIRTGGKFLGREVSLPGDKMWRQAGKRGNFLIIFDGQAFRLQQALLADTGHEFTIEECDKFIKLWFEEYPDYRKYLDEQLEFFKRTGICVSETGRIRRIPDIHLGKYIEWKYRNGRSTPRYTGSKQREYLIQAVMKADRRLKREDVSEASIGWMASKKYKHAIKAGYNMPIQGLAASIAKRAMIALHKAGRKIVNQVHDELVVSRKKGDTASREQVIAIMCTVYPIAVPVGVDTKTLTSFHGKDKADET